MAGVKRAFVGLQERHLTRVAAVDGHGSPGSPLAVLHSPLLLHVYIVKRFGKPV